MTTSTLTEKNRISSIDIMRGVVMIIMALDHVRDFFSESAFVFDPSDPERATTALFFTRWITHFCAPTFVFLAGASIMLSLQRKSKKELSKFLWTRGLWLVVLEFTVVRFSFFFNLYYEFTVVQVIYALGTSMIAMAALIYIRPSVLLVIGLLITFGHNVLDYFPTGPESPFFTLVTFFYQGGPLQIAPGKVFMVGYPFLPWVGVMILGYCAGQWYLKGFDPKRRQRLLLMTGCAAIILFVVLRLTNQYGDQEPWTNQFNSAHTFLSFLNVSKYPPSLMYLLMTLGPVLIILSLMEKISIHWLKPAEVFGTVPMFYYILHFYLIHVLAIATYLVVRHKSFSDLNFHFQPTTNFLAGSGTVGYFGGVPIGSGYGLAAVYAVWIVVILIIYPLCKWYKGYKASHNAWWLSYL